MRNCWTCKYTSGVDLQKTFGDELSAGWKGWVVFCDDNPIALINDNLPEEGYRVARFIRGCFEMMTCGGWEKDCSAFREVKP